MVVQKAFLLRWAGRQSSPPRCPHARDVGVCGAGPVEALDADHPFLHHPGPATCGLAVDRGDLAEAMAGQAPRIKPCRLFLHATAGVAGDDRGRGLRAPSSGM